MHPIPFTGRHSELPLLHAQLDRVRGSGTRLILISAPSGVGKTALVRQSVRATGNNRSAAARHLGMGRATLYRKLRQYEITL